MQYFPTPGTPDLARVERIVAGQINAWETLRAHLLGHGVACRPAS